MWYLGLKLFIEDYTYLWTEQFVMIWWQQQLQALLETLSTTEPHYIRCVKPNNLLKPSIFENQNVLQQLRCGVRTNKNEKLAS